MLKKNSGNRHNRNKLLVAKKESESMRNGTVPQLFQGPKRTHAILRTVFYRQQTEN